MVFITFFIESTVSTTRCQKTIIQTSFDCITILYLASMYFFTHSYCSTKFSMYYQHAYLQYEKMHYSLCLLYSNCINFPRDPAILRHNKYANAIRVLHMHLNALISSRLSVHVCHIHHWDSSSSTVPVLVE